MTPHTEASVFSAGAGGAGGATRFDIGGARLSPATMLLISVNRLGTILLKLEHFSGDQPAAIA